MGSMAGMLGGAARSGDFRMLFPAKLRGVLGQFIQARRHQILIQILAALHHTLQVCSRQARAPCIAHLVTRAAAQFQQVRVRHGDLLFHARALALQEELGVHRIAVAQGNRRLQPLE